MQVNQWNGKFCPFEDYFRYTALPQILPQTEVRLPVVQASLDHKAKMLRHAEHVIRERHLLLVAAKALREAKAQPLPNFNLVSKKSAKDHQKTNRG